MKRSTVEERQALCREHGHSWIKVSYSSHRRCSWCGEYESRTQAAWEALQSVPSYVEVQAQAFAAEPEPIPLAERGVLNGRNGWSLLK